MFSRQRSVSTCMVQTTENTALLMLCAFTSTGMCLLSRCLAVNYSSFQASCHNINLRQYMPSHTNRHVIFTAMRHHYESLKSHVALLCSAASGW
jgi:hypothetical protein